MANKERKSEEQRKETYEFTAFVSGPLISYRIKASDFEEAYGTGLRILKDQLKKYEGKVEIGKIEVARWADIPF